MLPGFTVLRRFFSLIAAHRKIDPGLVDKMGIPGRACVIMHASFDNGVQEHFCCRISF
ncbi:MAG: hypothetical protein BWY07_00804 [Candidatus Hydrogenedentes bacterium ADurb.Bin170]|jgi:hypothetical protein|nr:MAG: hypothetical protein BWY07_00804 [Candidatus Hydrogenedentes bacterium ADurb.Bin170]